MRQIIVNEPSQGAVKGESRLQLVEVEEPHPGADEILVRISASSLNFHDFMVVRGLVPVQSGRVPMSDGVGTVLEVGKNVEAFKAGDRVMGTFYPNWQDGLPTADKLNQMRGDQRDGFASELVAYPATSFTSVPGHLSDVEAATLPCAALTAWNALFIEGNLKPGDTVLTEGTGGVSLFALQFAKMVGARVIATTSSDQKGEKLKSLGADFVINYKATPEWGELAREITSGAGVDHVVDIAGGNMANAIKACRVDGNIYLIGVLSMQPIQFLPSEFILGNRNLIGLTVGSREHQQQMVAAIENNGLKPVLDRSFDLADIDQAFAFQESNEHFGKIGLRVSG